MQEKLIRESYGAYLEPCTIESFYFFPYHAKVLRIKKRKRIREYFYEFSIVIVPNDGRNDHWGTVVLDKGLLKERISEGRPETFAAIDGKQLTFKGNAR